MHGLVTINKLNELAAQNAPGAAEAALAAADASREGKVSQSELNFREATARARQNRIEIINRLAALPLADLLSQIDALEAPSTIEAALSLKLHTILARGHLQEPNLGAVDPALARPDPFPPNPYPPIAVLKDGRPVAIASIDTGRCEPEEFHGQGHA